jgi:hypothetical protein
MFFASIAEQLVPFFERVDALLAAFTEALRDVDTYPNFIFIMMMICSVQSVLLSYLFVKMLHYKKRYRALAEAHAVLSDVSSPLNRSSKRKSVSSFPLTYNSAARFWTNVGRTQEVPKKWGEPSASSSSSMFHIPTF